MQAVPQPGSDVVVVCSFDEHYVALSAALLKSLEVNHQSGGKVVVYIMDNGILRLSRRRLMDSLDSRILDVRWIRLVDVDLRRLPELAAHRHHPMYTIFFMPHVIPHDVRRIIYLDSDMLVLRDIADLWAVDLKGHALGAVVDRNIFTVSSEWGGIQNYQELGLRPDAKYFNTGTMLIDLDRWRREGYADQAVYALNHRITRPKMHDQEGLNLVFADRWHELDDRWNQFTEHATDPYILHYIRRKPVFWNYDGPYRELFYSYLDRTAWAGHRPKYRPPWARLFYRSLACRLARAGF